MMDNKVKIIERKKKRSVFGEWMNTIVWAGLIAIVFRSFLAEPFNIPSGSMIPTLQVGDHLFVKKWSYGYSRFSFPFGSWNLWNGRFFEASEPERGDIVVFRKPGDTIDYVKRLIGMPGDKIQVLAGRLYINGKLVERKDPKTYIIANVSRDYKESGFEYNLNGQKLLIKGNKILSDGKPVDFNFTIEYKDSNLCNYSPLECTVDAGIEYTEILPNGIKHQIIELSDTDMFDNTQVFTVPEKNYFMMGDDRDRSADSRSTGLGFVPKDNFMGRVWVIFYSHNYYAPMLALWDWGQKMRFERWGITAK